MTVTAFVGCKDGDTSSSRDIDGSTWVRETAPGESVTYFFTSNGYTQKTKYIFQDKTNEYVSDNGTYQLKDGDITFYSGMGAGVKTGTISGNQLTVRGFTYTKK